MEDPMEWWNWLTRISQSAAPAGEPFSPQGWYVALALLLPVISGALLAGLIKLLEKAFGLRLGGGIL